MERHEVTNAGSLWVETMDRDTAQVMDLPAAVRRATGVLNPGARAPRRCLTWEEAVLLRRKVPQEISLLNLLAA